MRIPRLRLGMNLLKSIGANSITAETLSSLNLGLNVPFEADQSLTKDIVEELHDLERQHRTKSEHHYVLDGALSEVP